MNLRNFLDLVPRPVRIAALIVAFLAPLTGLAAGVLWRASWQLPFCAGGTICSLAIVALSGLLFGLMLAVWVLGLGFVYADARRRAMRPVLWLLVAALFPHLLGFLLYFVMRQPVASICPRCRRIISSNQPFCSWCGAPQFPSPPAAPTPMS